MRQVASITNVLCDYLGLSRPPEVHGLIYFFG